MPAEQFAPLPLSAWEQSKITLHLLTQIVGKVRLALTPKVNHWWHAPLYVSARGLTTGAIPYKEFIFDLEFDFRKHQLVITTSRGGESAIGLENVSVAALHRRLMDGLQQAGIQISVFGRPFDPGRVGSDIPFANDTSHAQYDPDYVTRFWRALIGIDMIFRQFRGRFLGKCSPVHFFWHSFDLAVTRFSGRPVPVAADADPITREAYSHEVISAGFWPGDSTLPEPAFYTYVHPEPSGLAKEPLVPSASWWQEQNGTHMALLRYEDFRTAKDPAGELLDFLQSAYDAGARLAGWPTAELTRG